MGFSFMVLGINLRKMPYFLNLDIESFWKWKLVLKISLGFLTSSKHAVLEKLKLHCCHNDMLIVVAGKICNSLPTTV